MIFIPLLILYLFNYSLSIALEGAQLLYTVLGLHQNIPELERQLIEQLKKGKEQSGKVIVVYGGKFCYVNPNEPTRIIQAIIEELGTGVVRNG